MTLSWKRLGLVGMLLGVFSAGNWAVEGQVAQTLFRCGSDIREIDLSIAHLTGYMEPLRVSMPAILLVFFIALIVLVMGLCLRQRRMEARLDDLREQLADAIESIPAGFVLCDAEDRLVICNEQYRRLYPGVRELAVVGTPFIELVRTFLKRHPVVGADGREEEVLAVRMQHHRNPRMPFEHELQDGRRIRISERRTRHGGIVGIHADITDVRQVQEHLYHLANHDPLTGLPNRGYCRQRLEQALIRARRHNGRLAVMFLDLDRFKSINDTLGHHVGDELLQAVGRRLKGRLREKDILARLGGDEFMVILEDFDDCTTVITSAQRLIEALAQPFHVGGHEVAVATSIGVARFPEDGDDIVTLMQHADAASYYAKAQGPNNYCFYTANLNAQAHQRRLLENDLCRALERNELVLHYQPRIDICSGRLVGAEALLRWRHANQGLLSAQHFMTIAEDSGLIVPIGEWVLHQACRQYRIWQNRGVAPLRLAVNLSLCQFRQPDLGKMIRAALDEFRIGPDHLELEITADMLGEGLQEDLAVIKGLNALGVHVSIDDFGVGCFSLGMLRRAPLDALKIDRSLIATMTSDPDTLSMVNAAIALADTLQIVTTAEGVETQTQLNLLREQGCVEAQGFYFCQPLPAQAFTTFLQRAA